MRKILFRGKRVDNGEWVYGFYVPVNYAKPLIVTGADIDDYSEIEFDDYYHVNDTTVGQYTGFTDKNGKKIFEGDIVHFRISALSGYGEVKEDNGRFVIVDKRKKPTRYYPFYDDAIYRVDGNIHDTPELLEVTK